MDFSIFDLTTLEKLRLERFRASAGLAVQTLHLVSTDTLQIHCQSATELDELLDDIESLQYFAYLNLGVATIALVRDGESWAFPTYPEFGVTLQSNSLHEDSPMATAALEKPIAPSTANPLPSQIRPQLRTLDEMAAILSSVTGQPAEEVKQQILAQNPPIYQYQGTELLTSETEDQALEAWFISVRERFDAARNASINSEPSQSLNNGSAPKSSGSRSSTRAKTTPKAATNPAAKKSAASTGVKTASKAAAKPAAKKTSK